MVKTYEEEQTGRLSEREIKTLLTIFFRYIRDAYKQIRWEYDIVTDYGEIRTGYNAKIGKIRIGVPMKEKGIITIVISHNDRGIGKQNFPVTEKSPRELGRLAKNMFKWVKQQMEKI